MRYVVSAVACVVGLVALVLLVAAVRAMRLPKLAGTSVTVSSSPARLNRGRRLVIGGVVYEVVDHDGVTATVRRV